MSFCNPGKTQEPVRGTKAYYRNVTIPRYNYVTQSRRKTNRKRILTRKGYATTTVIRGDKG